MYDEAKDTIEALRLQFQQQVGARERETHAAATRYMAALTVFVHTFKDGPGGDPQEMSLDTTGTLHRIEVDVAWAEAERHRVRAALDGMA